MIFSEFIKALEQTPRTWKIRDGNIRSDHRCPLEVVARTDARSVPEAEQRLGLSAALTDRIIGAADNRPNFTTARKRLLKACGL